MEIHLKEFKMTFNGPRSPRTRSRSRASKQGERSLRRGALSRPEPKFTAARSGFASLLLGVLALVLLSGLVLWRVVGRAPVEVRLRIDHSGSVVVSGTLTQADDGPVLRE